MLQTTASGGGAGLETLKQQGSDHAHGVALHIQDLRRYQPAQRASAAVGTVQGIASR